MTTAAADPSTTASAEPDAAHPRSRSMESWRARLGLLASRGETIGPRVAEARYALSYWRTRSFLIREMNVTPERAEALLDQIDAADQPDAEVVASA